MSAADPFCELVRRYLRRYSAREAIDRAFAAVAAEVEAPEPHEAAARVVHRLRMLEHLADANGALVADALDVAAALVVELQALREQGRRGEQAIGELRALAEAVAGVQVGKAET